MPAYSSHHARESSDGSDPVELEYKRARRGLCGWLWMAFLKDADEPLAEWARRSTLGAHNESRNRVNTFIISEESSHPFLIGWSKVPKNKL